ncbi:MAG: biopolymer transporter ExbD [Bacteroidales bacterium]|nr:biopolymer transporter ExbD [Bacteroidales bacterium]
MSKFKTSKSNKEVPAISTASLPDIIFILLFFFMVSVSMRTNTPLVTIHLPSATQVQKLEKKSLVSYIYIGEPSNKALGTKSRIQLNDAFATVRQIPEFVAKERQARSEAVRNLLTFALKVDKNTKMGIVTDVKQELRKSNALKINYSTLRAKNE